MFSSLKRHLPGNGKSDVFPAASMYLFKDPLSILRQFLTTGSLFKMIKNVFDFMSKALFVLEIFNIFVLTFGCVEKRLDKKGKFILKFIMENL